MWIACGVSIGLTWSYNRQMYPILANLEDHSSTGSYVFKYTLYLSIYIYIQRYIQKIYRMRSGVLDPTNGEHTFLSIQKKKPFPTRCKKPRSWRPWRNRFPDAKVWVVFGPKNLPLQQRVGTPWTIGPKECPKKETNDIWSNPYVQGRKKGC